MKRIFLTTLTLALTLPAFAMEQYDAAALEKVQALNKNAQKIIADSVLIVAESSLAPLVQEAFLGNYEGLLSKTFEYLTATEEFIAQQKFEHQRLQEKLRLRKKIWFFHPNEINTDDPDNSVTELLADARDLEQRLQAEGLIDHNPTLQAMIELNQQSQNLMEKVRADVEANVLRNVAIPDQNEDLHLTPMAPETIIASTQMIIPGATFVPIDEDPK